MDVLVLPLVAEANRRVVTGGKAERRALQLGLRGGGVVEIVSGIVEPDGVIQKPSESLRPGQAVQAETSRW